jgi:hypothetical protein
MNIWHHINHIEELTYPLDGAASVIKMVAEQLQDNDHSSALWLASDIVNQQAEAISTEVCQAMMANRELIERVKTLEATVAKLKPTPKKRGRPRKKVTK